MNKRFFRSIGLAVILALWIRFGIQDVEAFLGGPGWMEIILQGKTETIDIFSAWWMMNWLLLFSPAWILGLWNYEDALNRAHMCAYRYRKIGRWWIQLFGWSVLNVMVVYLVIGIVLRLLIGNDWTQKLSWCMLLITVHALFSLAFAIWIRLLSGNMILAAVCTLAMEGLAKASMVLKMFAPKYSVFSWGMYQYSNRNFEAGGFRISTVILIQLCIMISLMICIFGKGKEILLRRINDGKVH